MLYILNLLGLPSTGHFLGAMGSFLLLLPPVADQFRRLRMRKWLLSAKKAPHVLKSSASNAVSVLAAEHSRWKAWESFVMASGGFLLMLSFWSLP
jgi:hypothetical protein